MATTIQQIELPKKARAVDTSGNNNHGQIYSGRGLEFDGITDRLSLESNAVISTGAWTLGVWVNINALTESVAHQVSSSASSMSAGYIGIRNTGRVSIWDYGVGFRDGNTILNLNTWYRVLWVYDGAGEIAFYVNGVADGTGVLATAYDDLEVRHIGSINSGGARLFNGKMSDFQAWDTAFTQADATYDYLNPESLALNNSGTALTESNLKLWYPMQDGHRGQQSYILDGANTGAGSEMVTNGDFSDGSTDWTTNNTSAGTHEVTFDSKGARFLAGATGTVMTLASSAVVEAGKNYRLEVVVSNYNGSSGIKIDSGLLSNTLTFSGNGTHVYQVSTTGGGQLISFYRNGSNVDLVIESVSLKAINDKHHATTVFYGDELITNGTFTGITQAASTTGSEWTTQAGWTIGSGVASRASHSVNSAMVQNVAIVAGRTYEVKYDRTYASGNGQTNLYSEFITDGAYATLGSLTSTTVETVTVTDTFTPAYSGDMPLQVYGIGTYTGTIDNVSVKEVGVASGWTDADQQLHIPQTALQSYNELAWFDGHNDLVSISDDNSLDVTSITISAWLNTAVVGLEKAAVAKSYATTFEFGINANAQPHVNCKINGVYNSHMHNTGTALAVNTWNHVAWTYDRSSNSSKTYLNGVLNETVTPNAGDGAGLGINADSLFIGGRSTSALQWNGSITEVGIWSSAITSDEVQAIFNDGKALDVYSDSGSYASSGDLVSYWRNNGLSTWTDLKGSNNGTPTNITETILIPQGVDSTRDAQGFIMNRQKDTSCLNLTNGSDDPHVDLGSTTTVADDEAFSFFVWLKPDDFTANYFMGTSSTDYISVNSSTTLAMRADNATAVLFTVDTIVPKEWIHVAVVKKASNDLVTIYINGDASVDTETLNEPFDYRYLGSQYTSKSFRGAVDGFLVYNSELDGTEVLRNYNATKGNHRN
mgnify:FL=1